MPLQTSRYLMMFSLVIVCICGFTLLDQLAGITKRPAPIVEVPQRSVRTTRSLQPGPPADPVFVEPTGGYDYPEYETRVQVPVHTASFANEFAKPSAHDEFGGHEPKPFQSPGTPGQFKAEQSVDWPSYEEAAEPPVESASPAFDSASDFVDPPVRGFEPIGRDSGSTDDSFQSTQSATEMDFQAFEEFEETPVPNGPAFPGASHAGQVDDELGVGTNEPWDVDVAEPRFTDAARLPPARATSHDVPAAPFLLSTPASRGEAVQVVGFAATESRHTVNPSTGQVVLGSHRIHARITEAPERRIRGSFRFSSPPVEETSQAAFVAKTKPTTVACRHRLAAGQKVCPKCGVIHAK